MKELKKVLYKITALSNLHVGSGDQNYGIVDKLVQRDPLTGFPVIHSSSLKGALKVYCEEVMDLDKTKEPMISSFGKGDSPGKDKFFSAHLLTIPVRSNSKPFFRAICPAILRELDLQLKSFGIIKHSDKTIDELLKGNKEFHFFYDVDVNDLVIEDSKITGDNHSIAVQNDDIFKLIGNLEFAKDSLVIIQDNVFMEICENLPVIARNRLDEQKNLWYEEVVPRQSEFYFLYMGEQDIWKEIMKEISTKSEKEMPVQIGANASVGYGFCKINEIAAV